jgi:DNA polymerase-3 subunit beta
VKARIDRDTFAEATGWVARTLPQRAQQPLLSGVFLQVAGGTLTVAGYDYEISARTSLEVSAAEDGEVVVSGRLLADVVRSLPGLPVEVQTDGARVVVTCGTARFALACLPVDEYPTLPQPPPVAGRLGSDALAAAVASVVVAAGRDDALPVLTGMRLEIAGDRLTLAATDRYRLAIREIPWEPERPDVTVTALVPARTLAEAAKTFVAGAQVSVGLGGGEGTGEGLLGLVGGGREMTTRLLGGEYPRYRSLLPAELTATATVETGPFAEAVRRVALVAGRVTPIRCTFRKGELTLEVTGLEGAEASEVLPVQYEGDEFPVAYNPSFLLDGLGALDSDVAQFGFTTPAKPTLLTGKATEGDYRYLLMPVRLNG